MHGARQTARLVYRIVGHPRIVEASPEIEALLGIPAEDFLDGVVSLLARIHPDDHDIADALFSAEADAAEHVVNLRLRHADGRIRCVRATYVKTRDGDAVLLQARFENAKSLPRTMGDPAAMANFRAMMENTDDYIYFKDRNHVFTGASQTLVSLCDPAEHWTDLLGQTDYDVFPEAYADIYYRLEKQVFAGIQVAREVQEILTKDGGKGWVDNRKYPIHDESGAIIGLFGIARDITEMRQAEQQLQLREQYQRALLDNFPYLVWLKDADSRFLAVNKALARVWHQDSPESMVGKTDFDFSPPELAERYRADDLDVLRSGKPKNVEEPHVQGDRLTWIETYKSPVTLHGEVIGTVGFARDITERKQAEETLRQAASVFEHAREGIMITDPNGVILDVNRAFSRITGFTREDILGKTPRILNSGRQDSAFYAAMWRDLKAVGYWSGEIWNRRKSGEVYAEILTIGTVNDARGRAQRYVALFTDITPLKEHQRQLEHIAHYDALTGLPNRVLLADRLHQAMAQVHRHGAMLAVAYLDLDSFKAVNDAHGHEVGDTLLTQLAGRMKQALRDGDTLARLGGDEFVVVLMDLQDHEACMPIVERLMSAAAEPMRVGDLKLQVSGSLGVTFYPQSEEVDADQLLRQADQAMYQAKQAGKNRFHFFDVEHDRSVRGHHESLGRIRLALSQREFLLHYQPKVRMRTGEVIGAEALIRWRHPERGMLPPGVFLPVIHDHPMAVELGDWVLDTALTQIEAWRRQGLALPVSVNIDALHLQHPDFVARMRDHLAAHPGARPGDLELEVLETSALEDFAKVSAVMLACRDMGISFALDDFGTGYSSLTYLKRLPAKLLKIDQSFVRDMLDDPEDLSILDGVLGLANAFRRQAIAEGVETLAHGEMLLHMGCELGQGYAIARPMPPEAIPEWLAGWQPDITWRQSAAIGRGDLAILFAMVDHRAWVANLGRYLRGELTLSPAMDSHQCRFGRWLDEKGAQRHAEHPAMRRILELHDAIHARAGDLINLLHLGDAELAQARLGEVETMRDDLLAQFRILIA
jgi:diguanylate cyclase (GGDEF)-like protein/PAS domain S-box-containing protein